MWLPALNPATTGASACRHLELRPVVGSRRCVPYNLKPDAESDGALTKRHGQFGNHLFCFRADAAPPLERFGRLLDLQADAIDDAPHSGYLREAQKWRQ